MYYALCIIYYALLTINYLLITNHYLLFTIYHLPFTIYYSIFVIYYLGKNPYLMEFDETPKFWYSRVARDAWINLTFSSDNSDRQKAVDLRKTKTEDFSNFN